MEIIRPPLTWRKLWRGADVGVTMVARAVNSVGLGMIGGGSLEEALDELESGAADAVIVLERPSPSCFRRAR